jgi:hypothetical protein
MCYFNSTPGYFNFSSVHTSTSLHHTNLYVDARQAYVRQKRELNRINHYVNHRINHYINYYIN